MRFSCGILWFLARVQVFKQLSIFAVSFLLGGYYHGKLVFPKDFPFKPPRIFMITPNGRFKVNTR